MVAHKLGDMVLLALALTGMTSASAPSRQIQLRSVFAPRIDRTDLGASGRYELYLSNHGNAAARLSSLTVRGSAGAGILLRLAAADLRASLALDRSGCDVKSGMLLPGGECVIYIDAALPRSRAMQELSNVLEYSDGDRLSRVEIRLRPLDQPGPSLGPPLGSGTWIAVHSPDWPRGHRRFFYRGKGKDILPGRFAIDFIKVSADGAINCGDVDKPANAIGYGNPVLAVAEGRIVAVRRGVSESTTISGNGRHDLATAAGNYVVLALGRGRYATYQHLRPGSIRVRNGETVRLGAIIGELGFTGDSTGPHLHLDVSNSIEPMTGEGLPFKFSSFTLLGSWRLALDAPFDQIEKYDRYVRGVSQFDTHQGVKGLEFPRVMVVVSDDEARGFMFAYDKLFGAKEKSKTDLDNEAAGKETTVDRTRRLFYVTCSRAEKSLAVVYYAAQPAQARDAMIRQAWFDADEIELIA